MIPRAALEVAINGGYQWLQWDTRFKIRCISRSSRLWEHEFRIFAEGEHLPMRKPWHRLARDDQFWECLCRALDRYDEKALRADFERRLKRGEKGYAFWGRLLK